MSLGIARINTLARILESGAITRTPVEFTVSSQAIISTALSKFGLGSLMLDATDDRIFANAGVDLRTTGEFTWECWAYPIRTSASSLLYFGTGTNAFYMYISGTTVGLVEDGVTGRIFYNVGTVSLNTWHHIAITRDSSNVCRVFYDGSVAPTTYTKSGLVGDDSTFNIGASNSATYDFLGFIDEVRISNICRYTTSFTPSTTAFTNDANTTLLLHFNDYNGSTNIVDDGGQTITEGLRSSLTATVVGNAQISTSQYKFGSSSAYFDGSGDAVRFPATAPTWLGIIDFTIEFWAYTINYTTIRHFYDQRTVTTSQVVPLIRVTTTGALSYYVSGADRITSSSDAILTDTWQHIAVVRSNGTTRMYLDGVQVGSDYADTNFYVRSQPVIGGYTSGANSHYGYIDEVRVSNIARYTGNFTPASEPFTNDANTILLLHMEGTNGSTTFTDDNS